MTILRNLFIILISLLISVISFSTTRVLAVYESNYIGESIIDLPLSEKDAPSVYSFFEKLITGTSSNPPLVARDITTKSYKPSTLDYSTTYYWKVVVKDDHGNETEGPIWRFTTTNPQISWQKALGGSAYDRANSVIEISDGGDLVVGYTDSNDGDVSGNHGGADMWVVKLK